MGLPLPPRRFHGREVFRRPACPRPAARTAPAGLSPDSGALCVVRPGLPTRAPLLGFWCRHATSARKVRLLPGCLPGSRSVHGVRPPCDGLLPLAPGVGRDGGNPSRLGRRSRHSAVKDPFVGGRASCAPRNLAARDDAFPRSEEHEKDRSATPFRMPRPCRRVVRGVGPGPWASPLRSMEPTRRGRDRRPRTAPPALLGAASLTRSRSAAPQGSIACAQAGVTSACGSRGDPRLPWGFILHRRDAQGAPGAITPGRAGALPRSPERRARGLPRSTSSSTGLSRSEPSGGVPESGTPNKDSLWAMLSAVNGVVVNIPRLNGCGEAVSPAWHVQFRGIRAGSPRRSIALTGGSAACDAAAGGGASPTERRLGAPRTAPADS